MCNMQKTQSYSSQELQKSHQPLHAIARGHERFRVRTAQRSLPPSQLSGYIAG